MRQARGSHRGQRHKPWVCAGRAGAACGVWGQRRCKLWVCGINNWILYGVLKQGSDARGRLREQNVQQKKSPSEKGEQSVFYSVCGYLLQKRLVVQGLWIQSRGMRQTYLPRVA